MKEEMKSDGGRPFSEDYSLLRLDSYPDYYIAADDWMLQIDIDSAESLVHCRKIIKRFREDLANHNLIRIEAVTEIPSKTLGHYHVIVYLLRPLPALDRIFYQAVFGSDRVRELRNWGRAKMGMPDPVLLM